jgi:fatty-acyl-CoA synthase
MVGYYRDPQATREAVDAEGWLHTGDLGHFDEQGHLVLCGRRKELIIVGGENVFPGEVEAVLSAHPAVGLSAVVGVNDPVRGEVPRAYVVLNPGVQVTAGELRRFCCEQLASFKVPREVVIRESLPLSPTGKVLKRRLAADG